MKFVIASDHAGFDLKEELVSFLKSKSYEVLDLGCNSSDSVDYPDFAKKVAERVQKGQAERGILICGSGIGMAITANRFKKIRAAVISDEFDAVMSRKHNDTNIACFGARRPNSNKTKELLVKWIETPFEGGRHQKRIEKIG